MNTSAPAARSGLERWAGLGGTIYAVLFVVGAIVAFNGTPDTGSSPAKIIAYYSQSSHRDKFNIGWVLIVLGVFFFLWFLASLRELVRQTDDGFLTTLVTVGGGVYATTTLVGWSIESAIKTMSDDTFHHQVYPALIHAADDAGYVTHAAGGVGIGTLMIATSIAMKRAGRLPGWAGWVGIVFGILAIGSIFFFPQFLIFLWLLVAGVAVFRAGSRAPVAPAAA